MRQTAFVLTMTLLSAAACRAEQAPASQPAKPEVPATREAPRASGPDWGRFRGPELDGKSAQKNLLASWPESGPKLLWKVPLGDGYSGISVSDGRLFTMYDRGPDEVVVALDAANGKEFWRVRSDSRYEDGQGNGPRSTPAVDGGMVYALGAKGMLHALKAKDGDVVWKHDLVKELGARIPQWGISTEPLVHGDRLYVDVGGTDGRSVVAFDKRTGKVVWTAEDDKAGYSSPLPITVDGVEQILFFTATRLVSLDPETGKRYWSLPWKTDYDVNAATPIFLPPDRLFVSTGYDTGAALFKIKMQDGVGELEELWRSKIMKNKFSSSIVHDGYAYGFHNRVLKCVNVWTGEEKWKQDGLGHGTLVYADGHFIVLGERGRLVLIEATSDAYKEKSSVQLFDGKCWTVPTLAQGRLYVRDEEQLLCLQATGSAG